MGEYDEYTSLVQTTSPPRYYLLDASSVNPSRVLMRMAHDASCRTFPGSVRPLVGRPEPSKRPPGWPG